MDFRQLQYLTAVAEHRNVTKAAESLYISQSALSHYIRKAEEELCVQLFDRSTTPISLTYAGKCYIESAQRILLENERLMKELREITENMTGVLRMGISRDRASYTMPRLVRDFQAKYPGIRVDIFTESGQQLREALKTGRIDLLLLPGDGRDNDPAIVSQKIYTEELVLCAGKGVLSGEGYIEDPKVLDQQPFFLLKQAHTIRIFCDGFFRRNKIHPEIRNELSSSVTCYRMAASGVGLAIVPYMVTQLAYPGMEMDLFSLGKEPVTWDINMYYRKDAYLGHPEQEMIRLARQLFSHEMLHD
jgi:DNA-binding transcriptional LysR family regulator